jgi:hypothetical protein
VVIGNFTDSPDRLDLVLRTRKAGFWYRGAYNTTYLGRARCVAAPDRARDKDDIDFIIASLSIYTLYSSAVRRGSRSCACARAGGAVLAMVCGPYNKKR